MKNVWVAIIILLAAGFLAFSASSNKNNKKDESKDSAQIKGNATGENMDQQNQGKYQFPGILPDDQIKNKKAVIKTPKGTIELELYADKAPKTVSNFIYLSQNKFYDGLTFHRVEPGFVIQGGDPNGNGTGGPGYEFEDEEVQGDYLTGSLAMANAGPGTNGSQFFICLEDQPQLPKDYSLFGQVISGMDVVKQIQVGDKIDSITIESK